MYKAILFVFSISILTVFAFGAEAPFTVHEPNAMTRTQEGVVAGVPFQKGEVSALNQLSLHGQSSEIAAQFNGLAKYEDGSYKWVLASFLDAYAKNQLKSYTVKTQAAGASPSTSIQLSRSGSVVQIDNGVLRIKIDTVNFTGIDSLYYNDTPVIGGKSGGLFFDSYLEDSLFTNGEVTSAGAVYAGPLRVTYRVQGNFYIGDTCGGVGFSFMITTYAGSDRVKLDVSIRNSVNQNCGNWHQVRRCYMKLPLAFTPAAETEYKFSNVVHSICKADIKNFAGSSVSMTVQENWGGGFYRYADSRGSGGGPAGVFQYHNIEQSGQDIMVDVIVEQDAAAPHSNYTDGYEDGPWFWMIDGFHKNSDIFLSFGNAAKSTVELVAEYMGNASMLVGRPDPSYLSTTGAYGVHNYFGTFEDEAAMWVKFGADTAGVARPVQARNLNYIIYITGGSVHYDMEEDPLEQFLLMWVRTGQRGFLDRAEGWAKYWSTNFTIHTDGWHYDGSGDLIQTIRNLSSRPIVPVDGDFNGPGSHRNSTIDVNTWSGCHFAGQGAVDWYCLTGDPEAKDAADDLAEISWLHNWYVRWDTQLADPLSNFTYTDGMLGGGTKSVSRIASRPFKYLIHYCNQLGRESTLWHNRAVYSAKTYLLAWNIDPRGGVFTGDYYMTGWQASGAFDTTNWPQRLKDHISANNITFTEFYTHHDTTIVPDFEGHGKDVFGHMVLGHKPLGPGDTLTWMMRGDNTYWTYRMPHPMDLYYQLTGDEDARDFLIGISQLLSLSNIAIDSCGFAHYTTYDFPDVNTSVSYAQAFSNWNAGHDICRGPNYWQTTRDVLPSHNAAYSLYYPSVMALGYKYTGDPAILDKSYEIWNKGLKRGYNSTYYAAAENKAMYGHLGQNPNTLGDRITGGLTLFYEAVHRSDTLVPEAVTDLSVAHAADAPGAVYVSFTAPAERGNGTVAEYQVKYDTVPIVEYRDFNFAQDYHFPAYGVKKAPWWYADNVDNEPQPLPAGAMVAGRVGSSFSKTDTLYFAVRSRDNTGNLSPLSNVFELTGDIISTENAENFGKRTALSFFPNPCNPLVILNFQLPKKTQATLRIFDIRGRLVKDLSPALKNRLRGRIVWYGTDNRNLPVSSGIYYARMDAGSLVKQVRIVVAK
jgi:hypothetical protein